MKAPAESLAGYLNFLLAFLRTPMKAVESKVLCEPAETPVSGQLFGYSIVSVGVAIAIVQMGAAAGMAEDRSWLPTWLGRIDVKALPVAALVAIVAFSTIAHLVLKTVGKLAALLGWSPFRGSIGGTINASTAFGSLAIPVMTTLIVSLRIGATHTSFDPLDFLALGVPLGFAIWIYLADCKNSKLLLPKNLYLFLSAAGEHLLLLCFHAVMRWMGINEGTNAMERVV